MRAPLLVLAVALASAAVATTVWWVRPRAAAPVPVVLAVAPQLMTAPITIARERGYFAAEGLAVSFTEHPAGRHALDAAMAGDALLATAADTPIAVLAVAGRRPVLVAVIGNSPAVRVVARRSAGIAAVGDLPGKRVGVLAGTTSEYFLDTLLAFEGIPRDQVEVVALEPEDSLPALESRRVDAIVAWDRWGLPARRALADDAVVFDLEPFHRLHFGLVGEATAVEQRAEAVAAVLRAVARAISDIEREPGLVGAYTSTTFGMREEDSKREQPRFDLRLDQAVLLSLENQARWIMRRAGDARPLPDLLSTIDPRPLRAVTPDAVTIIHPR